MNIKNIYTNQISSRSIFLAGTEAAALGIAALTVAHLSAMYFKVTESFIHSMGFWIPGSQPDVLHPELGSLGPYSGKESIALFVFLSYFLFRGFVYVPDAFSDLKKIRDRIKMLLSLILVSFLLLIEPVSHFLFSLLRIS